MTTPSNKMQMKWRDSKGVALPVVGLILVSGLVLVRGSFPGEIPAPEPFDPVEEDSRSETGRSAVAFAAPSRVPRRIEMTSTEGVESIEPDVQTRAVDRNASMHGQVIDAISAAPVREFRVHYLPVGEGDILEAAEHELATGILRSDLQGRFRLTGLPDGVYDMLIDPANSGYEKTVIHDVVVPRSAPLIARVGRGAHVEGRLLDSLGRPVFEVEVVLEGRLTSSETEPTHTDRRQTDTEGRFLFTRLSVGEYELSTAGSGRRCTPAFPVRENARVEKDLRLPVANGLRITVTGPAGRPVEGARVLLASRTGLRRTVVTDAKGEALARALPGERHAVRTECPGFVMEHRVVDLEEVGDRNLCVVLTPQG